MIGSTIVFIPELPENKATLFKRIIENIEELRGFAELYGTDRLYELVAF
jgi:hypothetical protein